MKKFRAVSTLYFFVLLFGPAVFAQDMPIDLTAQSARVYRAAGGGNLTLPSQAAPAAIVAAYLRSHGHGDATIQSLVTITQGQAPRGGGLTHVRFEQQVAGLSVYGTYVKATLNSRGELVHLIENLATPNAGSVLSASITSRDALQAALSSLYPGVSANFAEDSSNGNTVNYSVAGSDFHKLNATRVAIAMANGSLQEGFLVETWTRRDNLLHHTLVGRNGRVLDVELRTNNDSYKIFPDHPGNTSQTSVDGPGLGNAQSPAGWLSGSQTTVNIGGNNVRAYLDTDNNNAPDAGGSTVTNSNFLTTANLGIDPSDSANKAVAVQNLFYLNNVIHDKLYEHGFTEAVGNFQNNNFGNGGLANDAVNAEAQDGGGTSNANFSTPADGSKPRMQMYLWTQSTPRRDGDLDSDIVWHEYGHGLTWRMIGNMSGPMSGAIGEGMSDVLAILINNNDVVAEYSYNNPIGIRSARYTNYTRTYGDFSGSSVHFDGEIYAATIWRLWEIFQSNTLTQDRLFDYLVGGMNFTPAGPAMEDMRDGILQMVTAVGIGHECLIWAAFADFGIGVGAKATIKGGGPFGGGKVTITESFSPPPECSGTPGNTPPTVTITAPENGASFTEGASITFTGSASDVEDTTVTAASLLWTSNLDGQIGTGASFGTSLLSVGTHTITATATDNEGLSGSNSISVTVNAVGGGITLTARGYKVKGLQKVDLSWTGATSVDVYRDGNKIVTGKTGTTYTDNINNKGGGTYIYQVCPTGSRSNCSNIATVVF